MEITLRIRGTFIDFKPDALQALRKRSSSIPPKGALSGAEPDATSDQEFDNLYLASLITRTAQIRSPNQAVVSQAKQCYLASSCQRSERPVHASRGNDGFDFPESLCNDVRESASTTDLQFQFEEHPATPPNTECRPITTLMLGGIPCRLGVQEIIDVIDAKGFSDAYDLFYAPPPPKAGCRASARSWPCNIGYAFVNLKTPELATAFALAFDNFAFPNSNSVKLSYTKPARWQGFKANARSRMVKQLAVMRGNLYQRLLLLTRVYCFFYHYYFTYSKNDMATKK